MKLLYCTKCGDIFNLSYNVKICSCNYSCGNYINNITANYYGSCIPLGIANNSLSQALKNQPASGMGHPVNAFVVPKLCDTFIRVFHISDIKGV